MKFKLERNEEQEQDGSFVKYWAEDYEAGVMASLVYSTDFENEMEIRISIPDRIEIRGHKSIMDKMSYDDFEKKVIMHIERHESFKKLKEIKN